MQRGGGGEADDPRELDVRAVRVGLELLEQLHINQIKRNGHFTKYSIVISSRYVKSWLDFWAKCPILIHMSTNNRSAIFAARRRRHAVGPQRAR